MRLACVSLLLMASACGRIAFDRLDPGTDGDSGIAGDGAAADASAGDAAQDSDAASDAAVADSGPGVCPGTSPGPTSFAPISVAGLNSEITTFLGTCGFTTGGCDLDVLAFRLDVCAVTMDQVINAYNENVPGVTELDRGVPLAGSNLIPATEPGADPALGPALANASARPFVLGEQVTRTQSGSYFEVSSLLDDEGRVLLVLEFRRTL